MSTSTSESYRFRLYPFITFAAKVHKKSVDELVNEIKKGKLDVYALLGIYAAYLHKETTTNGKGASSLKKRVNVAKKLLLFHDVEVSENKLKTKLKLPRAIHSHKEPIDKQDRVMVIENPERRQRRHERDYNLSVSLRS
jgi:hypothetical protein